MFISLPASIYPSFCPSTLSFFISSYLCLFFLSNVLCSSLFVFFRLSVFLPFSCSFFFLLLFFCLPLLSFFFLCLSCFLLFFLEIGTEITQRNDRAMPRGPERETCQAQGAGMAGAGEETEGGGRRLSET